MRSDSALLFRCASERCLGLPGSYCLNFCWRCQSRQREGEQAASNIYRVSTDRTEPGSARSIVPAGPAALVAGTHEKQLRMPLHLVIQRRQAHAALPRVQLECDSVKGQHVHGFSLANVLSFDVGLSGCGGQSKQASSRHVGQENPKTGLPPRVSTRYRRAGCSTDWAVGPGCGACHF